MLDNDADEYRDTTLTVLLRDLFNRQERCSAKLAEIILKKASSANIKNAKKAANGDWHEDEEGCWFILPKPSETRM